MGFGESRPVLGSRSVSLAEKRWLRLFTLCVLYVAQGIPWGFMATTLPAYLVSREVDYKAVAAMMSFSYLPYAFKWIWGPIIDSVPLPARWGRRRPWIVFAQLAMAATVFSMVVLDVSVHITLLAWMVFLHTVFNSLQDVSVDALAIDLLPDDERGVANGFMYASKYGGGALGGAGMASLIAWTDFDTALVVQTAVLLAIMLVPLLVRERSGPVEPRPAGATGLLHALPQAFSLRSTLVAALVMLASNFATGLIMPTSVKLFVGELGWKHEDYTAISGGVGLVVGCAFALAAGVFVDRVGRRRVAAIATCALGAGWAAFALIDDYWSSTTVAYGLGMFTAACQATATVALIAMCMDLSWPCIAGTQFAAYMALSNFSTSAGSQFAGIAADLWTFQGIFLIAAAIQIAHVLLLVPIDPTEARRKLPLPEGTRLNPWGIGGLVALVAFLIVATVYMTYKALG